MLSSDLDALEEVLDGFRGPVKVQLCGPWTLAATLELPHTMNVAVADPGAVADLTASLAEGAAAFAADVAKRVPGARLVVQFDEPALPAVAEGMVPTASGLSRLAAVEADPLRERLEQVSRAPTPTRSCTAALASVPFGIIRAAGADGVAFDLGQLRRGDEDGVAEAAEAGHGAVDGRGPAAGPGAGGAGAGGGRPVQPGGREQPGDGSSEARRDRGAGHPAVAAAGAAAGDLRRSRR